MDVYLMTFNKRENSTERPTLSGATSGTLRDNCSVMFPSIGFSWGQENTPIAANYAYIPEFSRYYFIKNWTWDSGIWWADMAVDVLASWKTEIGNSTQYVLRAAAATNDYVEDSYYPMTREHRTGYSILSTAWTYSRPSAGYYIVGIISSATNSIGAVAYYAFTAAEFRAFMYAMLSTTSWTNIDFTSGEISEEFFKSVFNPFQYIVSALWLPFAPDLSSAVSTIPFGWWSVTASAHLILNSTWQQDHVVTIPKHPQNGRGKYLEASPYTRLSLFYQPFGLLELDPSLYVGQASLTVTVTVDVFTGIGYLFVKPGTSGADNPYDFQQTAQVGVPIQLAQIANDYVGALSSLAGGITSGLGVFSGGVSGVVNGIAGAVSGIVDAALSMVPHVSTSGANGSFIPFVMGATLFADFFLVVDEDRARRGRPVCGIYTLSQLAGYQMILNPDIKINGTDDENRMIKDYLMSGYFYE